MPADGTLHQHFVRLSAAVPADRTQMCNRIYFVLCLFNRLQLRADIHKFRHSSKPLTVSRKAWTTSMKRVLGIDEWVFTKKISDDKRQVDVSIHLKYPDTKPLIKLSPADRKNKIRHELKDKFKKLLDTKLFDEYTVIGTRSKPTGIKTKIPYSVLRKVSKLGFVGNIFINSISHAKKIKLKETPRSFYCVKMTVAIEIESKKRGFQTIEDRFVLIKANSFDDAYKKVEKHNKKFAEPYLNPYGELVRWRIESLDDCFSTDINSFDDLNDPEGVEVYSALKKRKLTSKRTWDGKPSSSL